MGLTLEPSRRRGSMPVKGVALFLHPEDARQPSHYRCHQAPRGAIDSTIPCPCSLFDGQCTSSVGVLPYPPRALPHLPASCRNLVLDAVSSLYSLHLPFSHSFTCRSRVEVARALKRCLVALSAQQGTNIWLRIRAKQIPDLGGVSGAEAYRHRIGTFASMRSLAFSIF